MKKVILVDDEKLVAEAIRRQVDWESCGAVLCRVCLNAFEALKAVEEVRPDIIITDIKMPVMDGLELVRRVRESDPYPEFIILSGYGEFELAKQAMKEGVKQFLLKPCSEEDIRRAIQSALRELEIKNANLETAVHKEGIRTALLRQTILTCLQEDFTSFFRDADFPMLMERDILLWAGFSQVPLPAVGRGLMDIFQGCAAGRLSFIPVAVRIGQAVGGFYVLQREGGKNGPGRENEKEMGSRMGGDVRNKEGRIAEGGIAGGRSGMGAYAGNGTEDTGSHTGGAAVPSGLMEELKETLAEYITRTLGIHPEKRICCPVNLRGLMGFMEREYGVYDGFYYTLGRNWFRREKMGLHSRPEKEFPEAVCLPADTDTLQEEEYRDFTDIIIEYVRTHYAEEGLNLKWIAGQLVFLNEDYVSKRFAQRAGCKFTAYLNRTRVEAAKQLLESTAAGSESAAAAVGYGNNPKYFTKVFKKYTGYTPTEYKQLYGRRV
ncbi:response regulator transcription factor [Eisenbergiella porci]|uniref:response regulator transcription factor n=1 Tax=Eisenbergiella porci TaxID=2652274 RepID=UPI002A824676|nr:response regulator [Eisenbergiella porci]